jgi:hypothetical protein
MVVTIDTDTGDTTVEFSFVPTVEVHEPTLDDLIAEELQLQFVEVEICRTV